MDVIGLLPTLRRGENSHTTTTTWWVFRFES